MFVAPLEAVCDQGAVGATCLVLAMKGADPLFRS